MMLVHEIMSANAECVEPTCNLRQAAQRMQRLDVGCLPICGEGNRLQGMVTDRDIILRAVAVGRDLEQTSVEEIMSHEVRYCFDDQSIEQAANLMEEKQIRRLVVLNRDKNLVGILSLGDIAARGHNDQLSGEALEKVCEPAH